MKFEENRLTYEEYILLRSSVGWSIFSEEQTRESIRNTLYAVTVSKDNQTIAMGRVIGDGMYYMIVDVIVMPEYQHKGIGSKIVDNLVAYVDAETPPGGRSSIQLIAEKGKEAFYMKKGFKLIPHEYCGSGMRKIIKKRGCEL